jgi:ABC-2 type transport system ATP-binding protein
VVFHLKQNLPALEPIVRALPFVRQVQCLKTETGEKLIVDLDNPEMQNPTIIRKLVEAGAEIQFVGELRHSLEEVYLSLLNKDSV